MSCEVCLGSGLVREHGDCASRGDLLPAVYGDRRAVRCRDCRACSGSCGQRHAREDLRELEPGEYLCGECLLEVLVGFPPPFRNDCPTIPCASGEAS